jgi:hypothetical protein
MRALLVALLLVAPVTSASVAGDPPGPTCGITVCAEAGSAYETACVETLEGEVAVLTCTFSATSFFGGHSPWMLPGRVFLSGDATARWSCTQGCAPGQVERNVNAAAWWRGGPSVPALDLGSADGGHVPILTQQAVLRAPAGSGACLHYHLELETTAIAEGPAVVGIPAVVHEEVYDGAGAIVDEVVCLA